MRENFAGRALLFDLFLQLQRFFFGMIIMQRDIIPCPRKMQRQRRADALRAAGDDDGAALLHDAFR